MTQVYIHAICTHEIVSINWPYLYTYYCVQHPASFSGSPNVNEKLKEKGRAYHVRNVTGRKNLITVGEGMNLPVLYVKI